MAGLVGKTGAVCILSPQKEHFLDPPTRSRAYPLIDLEHAYELLRDRLNGLGSETVSRDIVISRIGYKSSSGGLGARTVAALAHYGLLTRRKGGYTLSARGSDLLSSPKKSIEFKKLLRASLETPALFRRILDCYRPEGRVPAPPELAPVLTTEDFGITRGACVEAAQVFWKSAVFAEVLTAEGSLVGLPLLEERVTPPQPARANKNDEGTLQYQIPLPGRRFAYFETPSDLGVEDFKLLNSFMENLLNSLSAYLGLGQVSTISPRPISVKKEGPTE